MVEVKRNKIGIQKRKQWKLVLIFNYSSRILCNKKRKKILKGQKKVKIRFKKDLSLNKTNVSCTRRNIFNNTKHS